MELRVPAGLPKYRPQIASHFSDFIRSFKLYLGLRVPCISLLGKSAKLTPAEKYQLSLVHDVHWKPDGLHLGLLGPPLARPVLLSRDPATNPACFIQEKTRDPVATSGRLGDKCACGHVGLPRATAHVSEKDVVCSHLLEAESFLYRDGLSRVFLCNFSSSTFALLDTSTAPHAWIRTA